MTDAEGAESRKKDRSPNFPFISLPKAIDRARILQAKYRKEPARIATVGPLWGYGAKSSGLLQTVAALKQYGLLDDEGSGDARKIRLTELANRILLDTRPGVREETIKTAALRPRLFSEYVRWASHRPPDEHLISELSLDRGFSNDAARIFIRVFDDTMRFANIEDGDSDPSSLEAGGDVSISDDIIEPDEVSAVHERKQAHFTPAHSPPPVVDDAKLPLAQRLKVEMTVDALRVSATLTLPHEVDKLIALLQANKAFLEIA